MTKGQFVIAAQRWRWVAWVLVATLVAFGFDFKTPASQFRTIREDVVTIKADITRQDTAIVSLRILARALAIGQCLDRPRRETQLMGLPCDRLLRQAER